MYVRVGSPRWRRPDLREQDMTKSGGYHSAKTGQFVPQDYADKHPDTTAWASDGAQPTSAPRDAGTGRFVPQSYADKHPATTLDPK